MSYTPINWQTGDTITAEKLNKCDNGWSVESSSTQLCNESVTTSGSSPAPGATLAYSTPITADSIVVTFNGTNYTVSKTTTQMGNIYGEIGNGGPSFTNYPFCITSGSGTNGVYTESAGTYSVVISVSTETVETSANFQTAVNSLIPTETFIAISNQTTWQAIYDAMTANKAVFIKDTATDSVAFYMVSVVFINNETYQVSALYASGGSVEVRYYNADSADGTIYPA